MSEPSRWNARVEWDYPPEVAHSPLADVVLALREDVGDVVAGPASTRPGRVFAEFEVRAYSVVGAVRNASQAVEDAARRVGSPFEAVAVDITSGCMPRARVVLPDRRRPPAETTVYATFERAGTPVAPGELDGRLRWIAAAAADLYRDAVEADGGPPLAPITDLLTVTSALREVLGMSATPVNAEVYGPPDGTG